MGSVPAELSLNIRPTFLPKTISDFLYEVSTIGNAAEKFLRLDDYVKRLEEEMRKIDAFKRELPLCMLIMNDAVSTLKDESAKWRIPNSQPVLKEFIPLKKECDQKEKIENEKECRDKKNWMSSVQLCNTAVYPPKANSTYEQKQHSKVENKKTEGESLEDPFQPRRNIDRNGGFMPLAYSALPVTTTRDDKEDSGLSLLTPSVKNAHTRDGSGSSGSRTSSNSVSPPSVQTNLRSEPQQQSSRKQRRCWSPELHRRFVNALQQLGGSQVATPKQIRELMQVDGLTNDEVKSHLQKYRLHTRRVPSATATATPAPANQSSVVVLGGLLMSQDQYNDSIKTTISQSGSPQGPLQLARSARGSSQTEGDSMEDDEEDEKSESYGWKNHLYKPGRVDV